MFKIAIISLFLVCSLTLKFNLELDYGEQKCFFQTLTGHQKYVYKTKSLNQGKYRIQINRKNQNGDLINLHAQETAQDLANITLHRLAAHEGVYSFCIKNPNRHKLKTVVAIQSGLQLLQFEVLPDLSDAQNFERQLYEIERQHMKFFEGLDKMLALKSSSNEIVNIMPVKLISFSIIGVLSIIVTHILFYRTLKQSLKQRKFI